MQGHKQGVTTDESLKRVTHAPSWTGFIENYYLQNGLRISGLLNKDVRQLGPSCVYSSSHETSVVMSLRSGAKFGQTRRRSSGAQNHKNAVDSVSANVPESRPLVRATVLYGEFSEAAPLNSKKSPPKFYYSDPERLHEDIVSASSEDCSEAAATRAADPRRPSRGSETGSVSSPMRNGARNCVVISTKDLETEANVAHHGR